MKKNFWFIWFQEFFCLGFFKFSGPLWPSENHRINNNPSDIAKQKGEPESKQDFHGYFLRDRIPPTNIMYILLTQIIPNFGNWWRGKIVPKNVPSNIQVHTCPRKLDCRVSYHRTGEGLSIQGCLRLFVRHSKVTKKHAKALTIEGQPTWVRIFFLLDDDSPGWMKSRWSLFKTWRPHNSLNHKWPT